MVTCVILMVKIHYFSSSFNLSSKGGACTFLFRFVQEASRENSHARFLVDLTAHSVHKNIIALLGTLSSVQ